MPASRAIRDVFISVSSAPVQSGDGNKMGLACNAIVAASVSAGDEE
jgi:hypothetical protein